MTTEQGVARNAVAFWLLSMKGAIGETSVQLPAVTTRPCSAFTVRQIRRDTSMLRQHSSTSGDKPVAVHLAGGKAAVLEGIGSGNLQPFHVDRFEAGHSATNISRWVFSHQVYDVRYNEVCLCLTCMSCSWIQSCRPAERSPRGNSGRNMRTRPNFACVALG